MGENIGIVILGVIVAIILIIGVLLLRELWRTAKSKPVEKEEKKEDPYAFLDEENNQESKMP